LYKQDTRLFRPKRDKITGDWRKIHIEELHKFTLHQILLYDQVKDEIGWACSTNAKMKHACKILVGKPEGKRPLGRPRRRWEDNMNLRETGLKNVDWIHLAQQRDQWRAFVNTVMNLRVP
jgi:hypothetical protein